MRTRIAQAAAVGAAAGIAVTMTFLATAAAAPTGLHRPGPDGPAGSTAPGPARGSGATVVVESSGAAVHAGPLDDAPNPSHGARHHRVSLRSDRRHGRASEAPSGALRTWEARAVQMSRMADAWRAAHQAPPRPVVASVPITDSTSTTTPDWACIRLHESGDRFNTPAAPGGAYGFLEETWLSLGYGGWPYQAAPAVQSRAALYLYNELGWQPWSTRVVCGL
jgi:hypothetical protein